MKKLTLLFGLVLVIQVVSYSQPCLPEGISFTNQSQIDNFQTNHPNCTEIEGSVLIIGDDITNLDGLSDITSIGSYLYIYGNPILTSLSGLSNLVTVGGDMALGWTGFYSYENPYLTNLSGLNNLTSIGGDFMISQNDSLVNLNGLENLTSIGGELSIRLNHNLTILTGLENIEAASINYLYISGNLNLSDCDVQSICEYLVAPNGGIYIGNNALGCNSQEEVEDACETIGISDILPDNEFSIYPNPTSKTIFITSNNELKIEDVNIYNQLGQIVLQTNEIRESIDISTLGKGVYIIVMTSSELKVRQKLIIE